MMENKIIKHCAPTLAGLKTANMFNYRFSSADMLLREIQDGNHKLNRKGVYIEVLKINRLRALIYVYRKKRLEKDLMKPGIRELLQQYGYSEWGLEFCLGHLKKRLKEYDCFPHEIGVFLDYPLSDVIGFIEQGGKNCKCCGAWKVYGNECETREMFAKYRKCTEVYLRVFAGGRTLTQLTVAA